MTYYKGIITRLQDVEEDVIIIDKNYGASKISDAIIDNNEYETFKNLVKHNKDEVITKGKLYDFIKRYQGFLQIHVSQSEEIIYERIVDKSGKKFGKELITGLIFPLNNYSISGYIAKYNYLPHDTRVAYSSGRMYVKQKEFIYTSDSITKYPGNINDFTDKWKSSYYYYITLRMEKSNEVMKYIDNYIYGKSINEVGEKEVKEYLKKHSLFKKKKFIEHLESLYNRNDFKRKIEIEEIKEEPHKELVSQDKLTMIMENIEYMLYKMKIVNSELYNKYQLKYEELLKGEGTVLHLTPYDYTSFVALDSQIELTLKALKRNTTNIMDYLNALKKEYLDNLLNNNGIKTDITIKEIDKMNELFLKSKDYYTILDQRMFLKECAIIYLLELLENKDIEIDSLKNSYLNMHLKTIMMYINVFIEVGIIKSNILVNLEDELSLENVLEIISGLEINNDTSKERFMELIKNSQKL